jgi:MFS transporter, OFA family, oxalate/formate antiporter
MFLRQGLARKSNLLKIDSSEATMTAPARPDEIAKQSIPPHGNRKGAVPIARWWRLLGGLLMTLALGALYSWSVFVTPLEKEFGWKRAQTSTVFTLAVVTFAASFLFAGRLQDRFGPFWISVTGSILISLGFFLCAYTSSLYTLFFFYGVLGGAGNGFGYSTVVPVMSKWFPEKTGMAVGIAIAGYGGGSAIFGSLTNLVLFPHFGWRTTCMMLAGIFFVMTMIGAFLLKNPEPGDQPDTLLSAEHILSTRYHFTPAEILRTPAFYLLWLGFGLGSTAGLMVISQLIPFAKSQGIPGALLTTLGLVIGALGNVSGRVLSGWLSDRLGRLNTLRFVLAISCVAMPALYWVGARVIGLYLLIFIVYFCYGTQASVNPATASDFWGTRHAGANFGLLFTAWGFAGILGPTIAGALFDKYRNYEVAFYTATALAAVALVCVLLAKRPPLVATL